MDGVERTAFEVELQPWAKSLSTTGARMDDDVNELETPSFKARRRSTFELEQGRKVVSVPRSDQKRWVGYTCMLLTPLCLGVGAVVVWAVKLEESRMHGGLTGEYGVISEYEGVTEEEARTRIRDMVSHFNVQHFEFRDAFGSYSYAPKEEETEWTSPRSGQVVKRVVLAAFLAEIHKHGGQAWLSVQAMAVDRNGCKDREHCEVLEKQHIIGGTTPVDLVDLSIGWAWEMAFSWATFAQQMKFTGIHWDMIQTPLLMKRQSVSDFLYATRPILEEKFGLAQISNFIDGFAWKSDYITDRVLRFPYWTVWTVPVAEDAFFSNTLTVRGVFVCYPGHDAEHEGEIQNRFVKGMAPLDVLKARWAKARKHGNAYLGIADGTRIVQSPATTLPQHSAPLTDLEIQSIRKDVFSSTTPSQVGILDAGGLRHFVNDAIFA